MLSVDFGSLFRFLDALDSQVRGRESHKPPPEVEDRLLRLIRGEPLTEDERQAIFENLKQQPGWTAWLAEQVKAGRNNSPE